jgi:hypothetical protein
MTSKSVHPIQKNFECKISDQDHRYAFLYNNHNIIEIMKNK